ncbi:MAG TPA: 4,5-DOPA dioxygenase extradiol [Aggregatilineales bacterium]|nr:4,5-DOPA dioxygenase extradiol [Aggregatilineales bacterium]
MPTDDLIRDLKEFPDSDDKMPVLFVGHGSPTNAIEDNEFSRAWAEAASKLPRPRAVLCISAHWETVGTHVTSVDKPETIHDFYGFPRVLYEMQYPAPGSPALAHVTQETLHNTAARLDAEWGLDHGAWSVLSRMYPAADIPVVQLSLDRTKAPAFHYNLGRELKSLRRKGVLIVGSGNMVHNLRTITWQNAAYDWALDFDATLTRLILAGDHESIIGYQKLGQVAALAVPTNEHYLPLLYVLALQDKVDGLHFFADRVTLGSISMRSLRIG